MLTISIVKSSNFRKNKDYSSILYGSSSNLNDSRLHQYGTLCGLMEEPCRFNPSLFAIARENRKPVCLASITQNFTREGMCATQPSLPLGKTMSYEFPNYEIMAYTNHLNRRKGLAEKTIQKLLAKAKVKQSDAVYVYSLTMERILKKIGFQNVKNLHEYTP
jgi:hypothetical protein